MDRRNDVSDEELRNEAKWIYESLLFQNHLRPEAKESSEIQEKIQKVLNFFRKENKDIPYITVYHQHELWPELVADDVWRIFNLDQEFGKFTQQKNQVMQFFKNL